MLLLDCYVVFPVEGRLLGLFGFFLLVDLLLQLLLLDLGELSGQLTCVYELLRDA